MTEYNNAARNDKKTLSVYGQRQTKTRSEHKVSTGFYMAER